ncbi:MAG TPA: fused MFS/spermidine synthase [Candidatus Acidoferrum sp.]|nr:fused MFS/spermidine synthase [Candidatus Acidoferrum sp.]
MQLVQLFVSACALLPSTLLIGATFPCAVAVVARGIGRIGEDVGYVYGANTLGAIAGAAAGGFVIMPALGVHGALVVAAAANLALATLLLAARAGWRRPQWIAAVATGLIAFGALRLPQWDQGVMSSGPAIYARTYRAVGDELGRQLRLQTVLFYRDGLSSTVSVHRSADNVFLRVNGKTDASTGTDMPTQLLLGHLPLLAHPEPQSVLIIGMGSGVTAGAVARHPVRRIDVVEIEPAVVEASRFFTHVNNDVLTDPRVNVVIADGRNFLLTTSERYDVIISEPSNPWIAGLASLFSREFFELARNRLKPGGLMLQWVQAYSLPTDDLRMVIRTLRSVLPAVSVWRSTKVDLLLLGGAEPTSIEPARLAQRYAEHPGLRSDLQLIGVRHGAAVAGYLALSERDTVGFAEGAGRNTDDRLPLEFSAPRALYLDTLGPNLAALAAARQATPPPALEEALDRAGGADVRYALGSLALARKDADEARRHFERALTLDPGHVPSALELADLAYQGGQWSPALRLARQALAREASNARGHFLAGVASAALFETSEALRFLRRAVDLEPGNVEYRRALGRIPGGDR